MSYSNETPNYKLPIFSPSDKPSWLGAWNTAMTNIDTGLANSVASTDLIKDSVTKLQGAITVMQSDLQEANSNVENLQTKVQALETTAYIPIVSSVFGSVEPVDYSTENNTAKIGLNSFTGGFVRLSYESAGDAGTEYMIDYSLAIDGVVQNNNSVLCKAVSGNGFAFKTGTFFVPLGSNFYFNISVNGNAPQNSTLTVETASYVTKAIGKTIAVSNVLE